MAELQPHQSPMPAIRNRLTVPTEPEVVFQPRSPIPTPRSAQNRGVESPDVRRRTEPSARVARSIAQFQNERPHAELSPTAQLINKLFRNRDMRLLPEPANTSLLAPTNSRASAQVPTRRTHEEIIYSEIPSAAVTVTATEPDDGDSDSEYLSIDNLSIRSILDNIRTESVTPPPAYRSIFDDDK